MSDFSTTAGAPRPAKSLLGRLLTPFQPPLETIRHYNAHKFRKDILAGLTVSVVEVPQAMAYAIVAGVPPQYGLYTSVIQGIIGALLSSSEHMTTGPTNTQSLLIASAVHRLASPTGQPELYLQLVFALTALKGLIQLAFAAARMGHMVRYVSRSVISGLVSGAGVLIFCGQLPTFLGISSPGTSKAAGALAPVARVLEHLPEINGLSIAVGLGVAAVTVLARRISRFFPGALMAVVLSAIAVAVLGWTTGQMQLIDSLPRGTPHWQWASLDWTKSEQLFGGALALAVIGMLESVAIAKSIAAHTGERIDPNQEFFAQGLKNFISSFWQCIPGSGSFTRSALDYAAGAETRFAAVFNACFVGMIFWFFCDQARYIPRTALAGVLFVIAFGLIDVKYFLRAWRSSRSDATVCIVTFLATLLLPLEYAIFAGVLLNISSYLRTATRLHINEMEPVAGTFRERQIQDRSGERKILFLQIEGDLFFGVADELRDRLTALTGSPISIVILRLRRTHSVDATTMLVLEQFSRDLQARGGQVILCGVGPELMRSLKNFGLVKLLGEQNVFPVELGLFSSAKQALRRAENILGLGVESRPSETMLDNEGWTYAI